ncbi:unnamed protein product [Linum tenue]|uniref:F-box domain-containing protein n=1 Tax=Linum tenue TaxID=586396 RepID=A0AAV0JX24_9ROSI|nr:unnamed protein product [Linum tenue]
MDNNGAIGKGRKRCREQEAGDTAAIDRLSSLPDPILCHVLSFLDTKSVVQTSVLSQRWRSTWKHISVLNFTRDSFKRFLVFAIHVLKFLCGRHPGNIQKLSYVDDGASWKQQHSIVFDKVLAYASTCDVQHLSIDFGEASEFKQHKRCSDLFYEVLGCKLKTLELRYVTLDSELGAAGFRMLTTLIVECCFLFSEQEEEEKVLDPFSKFPCLKHLVLYDSIPLQKCLDAEKRGLKINGPHLLSLKLSCVEFPSVEVYAPKLERFVLWHDVQYLTLSNLTLPSLDHADIWVCDEHDFVKDNKELVHQQFMTLFQGLHNAKSLKLYWATVEVLKDFCGVLEEQPSPFKRLKSLISEADRVPYKLVNYFLKGSSGERPTPSAIPAPRLIAVWALAAAEVILPLHGDDNFSRQVSQNRTPP